MRNRISNHRPSGSMTIGDGFRLGAGIFLFQLCAIVVFVVITMGFGGLVAILSRG